MDVTLDQTMRWEDHRRVTGAPVLLRRFCWLVDMDSKVLWFIGMGRASRTR